MMLTEIAQQANLPLSTVARLVGTLEGLGFMRRFPDGSYGLGVRVLQLGFVARKTFDIIDAADPILHKLNATTGENTNLAVRSGEGHFTYIRQLLSHHAIRHTTWVGKMQPLAGTANGAALLGRVGPEGYAATRKTFEADVTATAAPVWGPDGEIIAAISVTGPTYRIADVKLHRYSKLVVEAAAELSRVVRGHGDPDINSLERRR